MRTCILLLRADLGLKEASHTLQQQCWQCCRVAAAAVLCYQHRAAGGRECHDTLVVVLTEQLMCAQEDQQLQDSCNSRTLAVSTGQQGIASRSRTVNATLTFCRASENTALGMQLDCCSCCTPLGWVGSMCHACAYAH